MRAAVLAAGCMALASVAATPESSPQPERSGPTGEPPRRLSCEPTHADYHPGCVRVGIRFNGEERKDVIWYDADAGRLIDTLRREHHGVVEPFWRYEESRQQRRARERWEQGR